MERDSHALRALPFVLALGLAGCGGGGSGDSASPTSGVAPDNTAPSVVSTTPADKAVGVAVNGAITVTFSEPVTGIDGTTFLVSANGAPVAGQVTYVGRTATFTPSSPLAAAGTTYTVTITTGVKDAAGNALASNYSWTFSTPAAAGNAVARAADGSVYVVGDTNGNLGDGTLANQGARDIFLTKYDGSGNVAWRRLLGTSADESAAGVAVDASGGVYVAGATQGKLGDNIGANAGKSDLFVVKLDANGNRLWAQQLGTTEDDAATGVAVDGNGGVYVAGHTSGALGGAVSAGQRDALLARFDAANGALTWTRQLGTAANDKATSVTADGTGIYVGGTTGGIMPGVPAATTYMGATDFFVAKFDASGNQTWTQQMGTPEDDILSGIAVFSGKVYVTGHTNCNLAGTNAAGDVGITYDLFAVSFRIGDGLMQWKQEFGSKGSEFATGVAVDASGVYVTGYTNGNLADPGAAMQSNPYDAFLVKYDLSGARQWVQQKGTAGSDLTNAVAVDGNGNTVITGYSSEPQNLAGSTAVGDGVFLLKYDGSGNPV